MEQKGKWPRLLTQVIVALIPKDGAKTEADLRPIGLTPIIYRLWVCVRKKHITAWTRAMYGARFLSASDHAWNTRVGQELARSHNKRMGTVFS